MESAEHLAGFYGRECARWLRRGDAEAAQQCALESGRAHAEARELWETYRIASDARAEYLGERLAARGRRHA